jgi:predicted DNA-binding protein
MESVTTRIPAPLRQRIKTKAARTQRLESEIMRDALEKGMDIIDPQLYGLDALAAINAHGGPADLAVNHDDYLYGDKS